MGRTGGRLGAGLCLLGLWIGTVGCGANESVEKAGTTVEEGEGKPEVRVVNYPLRYFAQRIGGDLVQVDFPVPDGVDPAFWRPTAQDVAGFQDADLVLLNGAGYARWLGSVSLPASRLVDTSANFADRLIAIKNPEVHSHGPEGKHEHGGFAFTTWLDARLAIEQARAIESAFVGNWPDDAAQFREGFEGLERDLLELDRELRDLVDGRDVPLLGSHPVYQYLARGYALKIESVHFEPDEVPEESAWRDLQARLQQYPARWMLWEARPLPRTEQRLRELGVASVVFDPCGNRPETGDYLTVQRANLRNLSRVFDTAP